MPSDFDLHYRYKNLPDDDLIKALTTQAFDYSVPARRIIRKILEERDVMLGELPEPTLQRPDSPPVKAESPDSSLFSATYIDAPADFGEQAKTIFKHRDLDPEGEEEYKRFDLEKNTGSSIKTQGKKIGTVFLVLYVIFRIIRFVIANN